MYYERLDVREAIFAFTSTAGTGVRETAIYNAAARSIQRYENNGGTRKPIRLAPENFQRYVREGARAFYVSYWYYEDESFDRPIARDFVWTIRPQEGGLEASKQATKLVVQALRRLGIEPWVKYDGHLGFDIIVPLACVPYEAWLGDLRTLDEIHRKLTEYIASTISGAPSVACHAISSSSLQLRTGAGTCLLSELRVRRGLLLAPMSLNPRTELVSLPVDPDHLDSFGVLHATPVNAKPASWRLPPSPARALLQFVQPAVSVQPAISQMAE